MQTLTSTLTAAQKQTVGIKALAKIVLTLGANTYTYTNSRTLAIDHREEPFNYSADVLLDNSDNALSSLDLKGYKGVISYGITTSAGDEYAARAPLWVIPQEFDSAPNKLTCQLSLEGIPNLLDKDKSSGIRIPGLSDSIKDILNGVLGATYSEFSHCAAYTVDWDSEDSLIDTFEPKQAFIISQNMSRLAILQRALQYTKCLCRFEADGHIHILVPKISGLTWVANTAYAVNDYVQPSTPNNNYTYQCTTAGTSHAATEPTWPTVAGNTVNDNGVVWTARAPDYLYSLASGSHTFLDKKYRSRLVIPNYVTVGSLVGDVPQYSGAASDSSYSIIRKDAFERLSLESDAQAATIANAIIAQARIQSEGGAGVIPLNVGQEVLDYIKITDARQGDTRLGNIGYLHWKVDLRKNIWQQSFGFGGWAMRQGVARDLVATITGWKVGDGASINIGLGQAGCVNLGDSLLHGIDTETTNLALSYTRTREILFPYYGYLRIKFDLKGRTDPDYTSYGRLAKNTPTGSDPQTSGTWIGTARSTTSDTYVTFSEDLDSFKPGDRIELWTYASNDSVSCAQKNFRFYYDQTGTVNLVDIL